MKIVVVGLDGASFELIDPWIKEGSLPNLARLKEEGAWADMESVLPATTSPNWKCYSTGKNPAKLGIFWWENISWREQKVYYPHYRVQKHNEIWDYLSIGGRKVGVIGMPLTFPPKPVNGFLISGPPDAKEKEFVYPQEMEKELREYGFTSYPFYPGDSLLAQKEKGVGDIYDEIEMVFKLGKILGQKHNVDFLQVTTFSLNVLHHFFWDGQETKGAWKLIDKHLADLMSEDTNLILMSDHGSNWIEHVFNINTWLEKEGYLRASRGTGVTNLLHRLGVTREFLFHILDFLKLSKLVRDIILDRFIGQRIIDLFPAESGEMDKGGKIDWEKSQAVASGQGPMYLKPDNEERHVKLREELSKKLEALSHPETGKRIIEKVWLKEEIYSGEYLEEAPDIILDQAHGIHIAGKLGLEEVFQPSGRWKAENKKFGLFVTWGPDIKAFPGLKNVSILDLAPTIVHMMGVPVPDDMDGRVLMEVFREDSPLAKTDVTYVSAADETAREKERIRQAVRKRV